MTGLYNFLCGQDLVLEVDEKIWDALSLERQEAEIDAQLCRVGYDPEKGYYLKDPIEISVRGSLLSIRGEEATLIEVDRKENTGESDE